MGQAKTIRIFMQRFVLLNGPIPAYFRSFHQQIYSKIEDYSGNRTQIVGVEGVHADHLTTTTTALMQRFV